MWSRCTSGSLVPGLRTSVRLSAKVLEPHKTPNVEWATVPPAASQGTFGPKQAVPYELYVRLDNLVSVLHPISSQG